MMSLSVASMDEIIHSAPWRPWVKSSILPAFLFVSLPTFEFVVSNINSLTFFVCMCRWLQAGPSKNPKVQGNVQNVCCHDLCCCFASHCFVPLPLWRPWMKSFIVPPGVHGEVIHSASGHICFPPNIRVCCFQHPVISTR
jgi:hypothetical protein